MYLNILSYLLEYKRSSDLIEKKGPFVIHPKLANSTRKKKKSWSL